jgi:deoxyribodipyrimidine photo-lyase
MLYYTADLPFPITHTPDIFSSFRKEVEKFVKIRFPLPTEKNDIPDSKFSEPEGHIPGLEDFGFDLEEIKFNAIYEGGETNGLRQVKNYFWETDNIVHSKETKNEAFSGKYSSMFSLYLAHGCLSPKLIAQELFKYEKESGRNESTRYFFHELLWREFFRLMGKKHGNAIFQLGGIQKRSDVSNIKDLEVFELWIHGRTGIPFIDAIMRELATTGYISGIGRQIVASFLVHDLNINWLLGAEYFESFLIDYDPCSNYGNWNFIAGVGSEQRTEKQLNYFLLAKRYDPEAKYVKTWIPELRNIPSNFIHQLSSLETKELIQYGLKVDSPYISSIIDLENLV